MRSSKDFSIQQDEDFCRQALVGVSRTFALNIPVLPTPLDRIVTVAYLLCRIADTLEDEVAEAGAARERLLSRWAQLVGLPEGWRPLADQLADDTGQALRPEAPPAEVELLRRMRTVLEVLARFPAWCHPPIVRCVRTMSRGMGAITDREAGELVGLRDLSATFDYCYYVAGTVGEMLTGLFIGYSPQVAERENQLIPRAAAFGRALQLTNILKDVREDLDRGSCWLPRDCLARHGLSARTLLAAENRARAVAAIDEVLQVARAQADVALEYTLALPAQEDGLRLFCLWPLLFAVATLRKLQGNSAVLEPDPVKISREEVQAIMTRSQALVADDGALRELYGDLRGGAPADQAQLGS